MPSLLECPHCKARMAVIRPMCLWCGKPITREQLEARARDGRDRTAQHQKAMARAFPVLASIGILACIGMVAWRLAPG
ncbi:MAG: hypothetical protein NTY02_10220, partial [Acidobacteria bacterium]|nr:hypothetical protein [Acidobacteriota bacterium]